VSIAARISSLGFVNRYLHGRAIGEVLMSSSTKSFIRKPAQTKAELREMLAEAVRNTQSELKRAWQAEQDRSKERPTR
jgi:hypothetical protein